MNDSVKTPLVPIRIAAQKTGVSVDSIRAWERRYNAVTPTRAKGGRLFSESDIVRLQLLKRAVSEGHHIGQIATLSQSELQRIFAEPERKKAPSTDAEHIQGSLDLVLSYIREYDVLAADRQLGKLAAFLSPRQFCFEIMIPLMQKVGAAWQKQEINMGQEHLVSMILRSLIGTLLRVHHPNPLAGKAIFSTPSDEHHEFGILASAVLALAAGFQPVYLGPNLPASEIAEAARKTRSRLVVLGVRPNAELREASRKELLAVKQQMDRSCTLIVGGGPYSPELTSHLDKLGIMYPRNFESYEQTLASILKN